jgi:hypothetical protein
VLLVAHFAAMPVVVSAAAAAAVAAPADAVIPDEAAIARALEPLRADKDLGGTRETRTLRWVHADRPKPDDPAPWLLNLFESISQGASLLLWVTGAIAAAFTGVWLYRYLRQRRRGRAVDAGDLPALADLKTFAPQAIALPDDIGAAAKALLEAGQARDALSLLYRGALARIMQRFGIAIGAAATEGEVLRAVEGRLDAPRSSYLRELVQLWQRAVYAGAETTLSAATARRILVLCANFDQQLGGAAR